MQQQQLGIQPSEECDDDEDSDSVVAEWDLYLSKRFDEQLALLQYPLRPAARSLVDCSDDGGDDCKNGGVEVHIKAQQCKLKLKVPLDVRSNCYDRARGDLIARNCAEASRCEVKFASGRIDSLLYSSQTHRSSVYALASVVRKRQLCQSSSAAEQDNATCVCIHPLPTVLQLRPNLAHLETASGVGSAAAGASTSGAAADSSQSESESEQPSSSSNRGASTSIAAPAQAVRVKFTRDITAHKQKIAQQALDDEPWKQLKLYGSASSRSKELRSEIESLTDAAQELRISFETDPSRYMQILAPIPDEDLTKFEQPATGAAVSLKHLRSLPLYDQLRTFMLNVQVVRFSQLMELISAGLTPEQVLPHLQQVALLVRGCWVVKSDVLFPKESRSAKTGIPGELLARARDYTLYLFTQSASLKRKDITDVVKVPNEDIYDVLYPLSRFRNNRGWEFVYETDNEFLDKHSNVVERQHKIWDSIHRQLLATVAASSSSSTTKQSAASVQRLRRRTNSRSLSCSEGGNTTDDESGVATKRRRKRQSSRANTLLIPPPLPQQLPMPPLQQQMHINNKAIPYALQNGGSIEGSIDNNTAVAVAAADVPEAALLNVLTQMLTKQPVLSLAEVKQNLMTATNSSAVDHLNNDKLLADYLQICGAVSLLHPQTKQPVFVMCQVGDCWPELRTLIVKLLQQKNSFRLSAIKKACLEQLERIPNDQELKRVLKEYCSQKSGVYSLLTSASNCVT